MAPVRIIFAAAAPAILLVLSASAAGLAAEPVPTPEPVATAQATAPSSIPESPCQPAAADPPGESAQPGSPLTDEETPSPSPGPSGPVPCASSDPASADATAAQLTVEAGDLWFRPGELTISSQGTTTITLTDVGAAVHNLTVDALDLQVVAVPGSSSQASIVAPQPGTYEFYCSVSGHRAAGMFGTLTVE